MSDIFVSVVYSNNDTEKRYEVMESGARVEGCHMGPDIENDPTGVERCHMRPDISVFWKGALHTLILL